MYGRTRSGKKFTITTTGEIQVPVTSFEETVPPKVMEKVNNTQERKTEICPVFCGKGYIEWKQRLKLLFARKGLKSLLRDSDDEQKCQTIGNGERRNHERVRRQAGQREVPYF